MYSIRELLAVTYFWIKYNIRNAIRGKKYVKFSRLWKEAQKNGETSLYYRTGLLWFFILFALLVVLIIYVF